MTLVVCKIIDNELFMYSDVKLTYANYLEHKLEGQPRFSSIIKSAIINPFICISYAGHVKHAENALIECMKKENVNNINNIYDILEKFSSYSEKTVFALGVITVGNIPRLQKIENGKICGYDNLFLNLGDKDAFDEFKQVYDLEVTKKSEKDAMKTAFDKIVYENKFETVGHFPISIETDKKICPTNHVFQYQLDMRIHVHLNPDNIPSDRWGDLSLGNIENNDEGIFFFSSLSPKYHAIAVHYFNEDVGMLFCPQLGMLGEEFKKIQGKQFKLNGKEFINMIKEKYNIPMCGMARISDSVMQYMHTQDRDENGKLIPLTINLNDL